MRILALTAVVALALAGVASGGKPTITTEVVDETEIGVIDCGSVALDEHVIGVVKVRSTFDANGELTRSLSTFRLKHTFTNPLTGASLRTPDVGIDKLTVHEDGGATLMIIGIVGRVVVPGQGLVAGQIGQLRLFFDSPEDMDPDVLLEAGHQDSDEELDAALCAALA
jgi:hypothetical protein